MKKLLVISFAALVFSPLPVFAEFLYSGMRQGINYKIYIHEKQDLGGGRWRFRTKAKYSRGKDYYSPWRTADCLESTIDSKTIAAIDRSGAEEGESKLIRTICQRDIKIQ